MPAGSCQGTSSNIEAGRSKREKKGQITHEKAQIKFSKWFTSTVNSKPQARGNIIIFLLPTEAWPLTILHYVKFILEVPRNMLTFTFKELVASFLIRISFNKLLIRITHKTTICNLFKNIRTKLYVWLFEEQQLLSKMFLWVSGLKIFSRPRATCSYSKRGVGKGPESTE